MYSLNQEPIINDYSVKNKISSIEFSSCKLENANSIYINKYEISDFLNKSNPMMVYLKAWKIIDSNIIEPCNNSSFIVKMPIPEDSIIWKNKEKIFKYQNLGINLLNKSHPYFNDRCFYHYERDKEEYTLEKRRKNDFLNYTVSCSEG
jgi:hypothetical protein